MNVYDFDGTVYDGDSTLDFFWYSLSSVPSIVRFLPKQLYGFIMYRLNKISKTKFKETFFCFLSAIDTNQMVENFWEKNQKKVSVWYLEQQQTDDIIISASPEFLLKSICERIGIRHLIASKVDIQSGKFMSPNCYGYEKVRRLIDEFHVSHIDSFYSDSYSDLPLAQMAQRAFMVDHEKISEWIGRE